MRMNVRQDPDLNPESCAHPLPLAGAVQRLREGDRLVGVVDEVDIRRGDVHQPLRHRRRVDARRVLSARLRLVHVRPSETESGLRLKGSGVARDASQPNSGGSQALTRFKLQVRGHITTCGW